jgi:sugar fermentation stimulation protein A
VEGSLIRRYKRFLADIRLAAGEIITCHNTNTGSMLGCSYPGAQVFLSVSPNPKRKYSHTWELVQVDTGLVGVNTSLPNKLAALAFKEGVVPGVRDVASVQSEVRFGSSRLDLLLTGLDGRKTFVEVKNCTLVQDGYALFPDAVSARATRHLNELMEIKRKGDRAIILIIVARQDALRFAPADTIDPLWGETLRKAVESGVELKVHEEQLSLKEAVFGRELFSEINGRKRP